MRANQCGIVLFNGGKYRCSCIDNLTNPIKCILGQEIVYTGDEGKKHETNASCEPYPIDMHHKTVNYDGCSSFRFFFGNGFFSLDNHWM